jgi:hypothetical protein
MTKCHHPYPTQLEVRINIHAVLENIPTSARHFQSMAKAFKTPENM